MREIKFRAKTKEHDKFVYGYLFKAPLTAENCGCDSFLSGREMFWCISTEDGVVYEIDIKTAGQYTVLKDKHRQEVYGGDILESMRVEDDFVNEGGSLQRFLAEVKFKDGKWIAHEYPNQDDIEFELYDYDFDKVIGNIHQNPELLK